MRTRCSAPPKYREFAAASAQVRRPQCYPFSAWSCREKPGTEHLSLYQAAAGDDRDGCSQERDHKDRWQNVPEEQMFRLDDELTAQLIDALEKLETSHPDSTEERDATSQIYRIGRRARR